MVLSVDSVSLAKKVKGMVNDETRETVAMNDCEGREGDVDELEGSEWCRARNEWEDKKGSTEVAHCVLSTVVVGGRWRQERKADGVDTSVQNNQSITGRSRLLTFSSRSLSQSFPSLLHLLLFPSFFQSCSWPLHPHPCPCRLREEMMKSIRSQIPSLNLYLTGWNGKRGNTLSSFSDTGIK